MHGLHEAVREKVSGECEFCAEAFELKDQVKACQAPLVGDYAGHPSFRKLLSQGYQIITF